MSGTSVKSKLVEKLGNLVVMDYFCNCKNKEDMALDLDASS